MDMRFAVRALVLALPVMAAIGAATMTAVTSVAAVRPGLR